MRETSIKERQQMREYYENNKVAILIRQDEYQRRYSKTAIGKSNKIANVKRMALKYPERYRARYTLRNLLFY